MRKIGVTQAVYTSDMDSLACSIAYTELLNLEGKNATAYIPKEPAHTVTSEIKSWDFKYEVEPKPEEIDDLEFVLVDTTDPHTFPKFVKEKNIIEIYDHHVGYEDYWEEKLGDRAKIDIIGSCATLIWEEYKKRGFAEKISQTSAKMLYAAIISNTLNFKAALTTQRDILAFQEVSPIADIPEYWIQKYFIEQEEYIYQNTRQAILDDIKIIEFPNLGEKIAIGQIELWESKKFVLDYKPLIKEVLDNFDYKKWFFNAPCISMGKTYVLTENDEVKKILEEHFDFKFQNEIGEVNKLIERKEFVKAILKL
ncbi:DHH family phosphoesterase [Patescibacteria group bacterium]|nr:DHH family phosphoesterase [Patescibacteria group bacterium]